jgi:hypothetical protein
MTNDMGKLIASTITTLTKEVKALKEETHKTGEKIVKAIGELADEVREVRLGRRL